MMTNDEFRERLQSISAMGGDSEAITEALGELQTAYEQVNVAPKYTDADVKDKDGTTWKDKYDEMRTRYRERFFNGSNENNSNEEGNAAPSSETINFDDLFKEV